MDTRRAENQLGALMTGKTGNLSSVDRQFAVLLTPPADAVNVTMVFLFTAVVVTLKVDDVVPPAIVTTGCTDAFVGLLLDKLT